MFKLWIQITNRGNILIPYGTEIVGKIQPADNGSQFVAASVDVPSFSCDVITLDFLGIQLDLNRK